MLPSYHTPSQTWWKHYESICEERRQGSAYKPEQSAHRHHYLFDQMLKHRSHITTSKCLLTLDSNKVKDQSINLCRLIHTGIIHFIAYKTPKIRYSSKVLVHNGNHKDTDQPTNLCSLISIITGQCQKEHCRYTTLSPI